MRTVLRWLIANLIVFVPLVLVKEPEVLAPAFKLEDFESGWTPENCGIIDKPYEALKQERLRRREQ